MVQPLADWVTRIRRPTFRSPNSEQILTTTTTTTTTTTGGPKSGDDDNDNDVNSISGSKDDDLGLPVNLQGTSQVPQVSTNVVAKDSEAGQLNLLEDSAGGLGRHLGLWSTTFLIIGRVIGTGIFSVPASILTSVGSVGASLMLWVFGMILAFCGAFVWLEFACIWPRSGGEKVYLEGVYKKPRMLATTLFAVNAILLGFTAQGCLVFAQNILIVAGHTATRWATRGIAIGVILFVTCLHSFIPKTTVKFMNLLGIFKIGILLFIVVTGWVVLSGNTKVQDPYANFRDGFAGSVHSANPYATALFKVINSYAGWSNAMYVMNEVKNPVRTIKIAAPLGLGICALLYILANISYFAAVSKAELLKADTTVASIFFLKVFGETAQRALTVFVAISALGNVLTVTFAQSRVNQEIGKEGLLPFSKIFSSNWPMGAPTVGLIVHLIPSVIVIIGPPPGDAYSFILDVEGYPGQIINLFVVIGLFWLRWKHPEIVRPFKVWLPVAFFFFASAIFLLVVPFIRPPNGKGDNSLPYYLYAVVGIGVMAAGVGYWAVAWKFLPWLLNYDLVPEKSSLKDGTIVTEYIRVPRRKIED